ncbi:hypothetical protein DRE_05105 [Drechslerella stenobrocha 248]|uniref:AHC1-like C2H2 zinc-finger domain-containing protein n=1 Tax=Drechslerella stenobrocha 248 TaxID=1043628 RepID=W7I0M1_9PEZI|nr:hypothetical protein DRE_05105 [Drechslerella stenobrocha 248]
MTQQQLAGPLHPEPLLSSATSASIGSAPGPSMSKFPPSPHALSPHKPVAQTYTPSALKGIAASALEQPDEPPLPTTTAMNSPPPTLSAPAQDTAHPNSPAPPHLRLATNNMASFTPLSHPLAESIAEMAAPVANTASIQANTMPPALSQTGTIAQPPRPHNTHSGKRPSMRHITTAQPEMTDAQREARSEKIRDIINEQFGLEILIKHRELQDIEAELGKAEACLEQIRRCAIEEAMEKDGHFDDPSGVSIMYTPSQSVLDGPYSGHYREWLMEERIVESRPAHHDVLAPDQSRNFTIGRRVERLDPPPPPQVSQRPQREAAPPSQKRPSVCLHRQPDGSLVKLACLDCKRSQFGSMQGFINHCRLAHQRDFQTHDHAAAACGTPFDPTGYEGQLPPPRNSRASKYTNTSTGTPKANRSSSNIKKAPKPNSKKNGAAIPMESNGGTLLPTGPLTPPLQAEDLSLQKTIQTSHLKEYLSRKQMEVENLDTMVEEAVNRVGMVEESEGDEEEGEEVTKDVVRSSMKVGGTSKKKTEVASAPTPAHLQGEPPSLVDVQMTGLSVESTVTVEDTNMVSAPAKADAAAADSAYEGSEDITDVSEVSGSVRMVAPRTDLFRQDEEQSGNGEEQSRPSSRRSNTTARQTPRTPVAAPRMGTRAHPSPDAENHLTRHRTRLAEAGISSPGKRA